MPKNQLIATALSLRGNPRACVYTEPMWGLSMNLCLPYASVYMLALGLNDARVGLVVTVGLISQTVFGLLGGVITDKLGRRATTAWFDLVAWCVPCLIWAGASWAGQDWAFWVFLGAAVVNGAWQVTQNSWDCLMVEDAKREQLTGIYSLVITAGQLSALFAPIAAVLVAKFSLVPAVRILYLNAFVVMAAKVFILYFTSHETAMGIERRRATAGQSIWSLLLGYRGVLGVIKRSQGTKFALLVMFLVAAAGTINTTFFQVIASKKLGVPDPVLPLFPMTQSLLAIIFFFTVIPRLTESFNLRRPLLAGFGVYLAGQSILALIPPPRAHQADDMSQTSSTDATFLVYCLLGIVLLAGAFGGGILAMLAESLVALHVDQTERSRVMAVQRTVVMLAVAPFGWLSGLLSGVNRSLPFTMAALFMLVGLVATLVWYRPLVRPHPEIQPSPGV
ncbi:MAG: MFS transporter [Bifidobacteriaceae bacterium]|jgi:MFS family permease|nr:MFS transporter [Bifidobacteriaceae bacterium]